MARPYDRFRAHVRAAAVAFEAAAETARSSGDTTLAHSCSQQAIRCRYLAEQELEVADAYDKHALVVVE